MPGSTDSPCASAGAVGANRDSLGLVVLLGLWLVVAFVYASVVPPFDGPDAEAHFRYALYLQQEGLPSFEPETAAFSHEAVQQPPLYYALVAAVSSQGEMALASESIIGNPYILRGLSSCATIIAPEAPSSVWWTFWKARLITLAGAALCIVATWLWVRALCPGRGRLALASAALVGLNPQFVFTSSTITNDTWVAGASALAAWLATRAASHKNHGWSPWLLAGAAAGGAALAKYSGLAVLAPVGILWIGFLRREGAGRGVRAGAGLIAGWLAIAGYWYLRNLVLVGEPVPLRSMLPLMEGLARESPTALAGIVRQLTWLPYSYWGVFGYGVRAQPGYDALLQVLMLLALPGLIILAWRQAARAERRAAVLAAVWLVITLLSLVNWMRLVRFADQGRLLFVAAPAVSLLLALGWQMLWPEKWRQRTLSAVPLLFMLLVAWQVPVLKAAYAPPPVVDTPHPQRPLDVLFADNSIRLHGIDLPQGAAIDAHGEMPVTLYFSATRPIPESYTLHLHLATADDHLLFQWDRPPAEGRHPTRAWKPGEVFADTYTVQIGALEDDGLARLILGFYPHDDVGAGESVVLADVRLHAGPQQVAAAADVEPVARWVGGIELADARVAWGANHSPQGVTLAWHAREVIHEEYTVSLQWLDHEGQLVAQVDSPPQEGLYPTSTWRPGDVIVEQCLLDAAPAEWERVIVLLYDRAQQRLPVEGQAGTDHIILATR